jgi:hypothetical protein
MTKEEASRWYEPGGFTPEPTDQPYNGWSNYKTWVTDAWLTSDEDSYEAARASLARGGSDALRAYVQDLPDIQQALHGSVPSSGLVTDLYKDEQQNARETRGHAQIMRDALDKVNWQVIAEALREE